MPLAVHYGIVKANTNSLKTGAVGLWNSH